MRIGVASPVSLHLLSDLLFDSEGLPRGYEFAPMSSWVRSLLSRGHQVEIFTLDVTVNELKRFVGEGLTVYVVPMRAEGRGQDMYRQERAGLAAVMQASDIEILHAHWTYEFALAALDADKPVVVTAHDAPWKILSYFLGANRTFAYRLSRHVMALQVSRRAPLMTSVSPYIGRHYRLFMGYRGPGSVVPNALPADVLERPLAAPRPAGPVVFASVNRGWSRYKNVSSLLHAFGFVRRVHPDAQLLLFGEGYEPGGEAQRYAEAHGLSGGVRFEGKTEYQTLLDRLSAEVDVVVHPSLQESFGMSMVEAMSLGLPMVAGRRSGAVPWVTGGEGCARLVNVRDPRALAVAMLELAASPAERVRLGRAGAASVRERFTLDRMLDGYEEAYRRALSLWKDGAVRATAAPHPDTSRGTERPRLTVLLACHNRREKTVRSLRHLLAAQAREPHLEVRVVLFDDGSTDGTAGAARAAYPGIEVLQGDGQAFWNGGMARAFEHARARDPDFYLWLNDDTFLFPEALTTLFETSRVARHAAGEAVIVVGAVRDPDTGEFTYGARRRAGLSPMRLGPVRPGDRALWADTFDGNCVLIPREVVRRVGGLDPRFKHAMGDTDYGLRTRRAGGHIRSTATFVGTCVTNPLQGTWQDRSLPTRVRLRKLGGLKGLPRADWRHLLRRHGGPLWPLWMVAPRVRVLAQGLGRRLRGRGGLGGEAP